MQIHKHSVYTNTVNDEMSVILMKCYIFEKPLALVYNRQSFCPHMEWSLNIAFANQFYCRHYGIGFQIIEFLQIFAMFPQLFKADFTVIYLVVSLFLDALASLAFKLSLSK